EPVSTSLENALGAESRRAYTRSVAAAGQVIGGRPSEPSELVAGPDLPHFCGKHWCEDCGLAIPLHQFEGDALGTLEEPQRSADVVHLVAQHGYAVGHEVCGGRLNVVNAKREVIEAPLSQIRRVRTRIGPWGRSELKQLNLEMRMRSFECEGDVLRFHARHAHVPGGKTTVDRRDVILFEAKQREKLDRLVGVCHCDSNMIRIQYHFITPCHQRRALS